MTHKSISPLQTDILPLSRKELNELHAGLGQEMAEIIDQSPDKPFTAEQESSLRALKKKREAVEQRTRMKFKQEQQAYDRRIKPYKEMADLAFDCIANRLGLQNIDKKQYGVFCSLDENLSVRGKYSVDPMMGHLITLRSDADMTTVSEEVGHHFRNLFVPPPKRAPHSTKEEHAFSATHEFFGYLGRKLVYESLSPQQQKKFFPEGPPHYDPSSGNKEVSYLSKQIINKAELRERFLRSKSYRLFKEEFEHWRKNQQDPEAKSKLNKAKKEVVAVYDAIKRLNNSKKSEATDRLTHHMGYKYGSRVDPHKLDSSGLYSLFSLDDQQVKRNFFKDHLDYNFIEKYDPPKHSFDRSKKGILENKVIAMITLVGVLVGLSLSGFGLTGYMVSDTDSPAFTATLGIIIFVASIGLFMLYKKHYYILRQKLYAAPLKRG